MAKSKNTQTEADKNLMYALIVLVLVIVLFWAIKTGAKNYPGPAPLSSGVVMEKTSYPEIENSDELDKASSEMDSSDLNNIDKELNSLDSESASF